MVVLPLYCVHDDCTVHNNIYMTVFSVISAIFTVAVDCTVHNNVCLS